jgi:hypothetical protein
MRIQGNVKATPISFSVSESSGESTLRKKIREKLDKRPITRPRHWKWQKFVIIINYN